MPKGNVVLLLTLAANTADAVSRAGRWWPFHFDAPSTSPIIEKDTSLLRGQTVQSEGELWNYQQEGMDWKMGECCVGNSQSPLNISQAPTEQANSDGDALLFNFPVYKLPVAMANDGRSLVATLEKPGSGSAWIGVGSSVNSLESHWELYQIMVHSPSEHTFNGERVPLELQFVHRKAEHAFEIYPPGNTLAVLSVGYRESAGETSTLLDALRQGGLPQSAGKTTMVNREPSSLDLEEAVGSSSFWQYQGSLTTPPCSVGVQWFVRESPLPASSEALQAFESVLTGGTRRGSFLESEQALRGNARGFQPTCGRGKVLRIPRDAEGQEPPLRFRSASAGSDSSSKVNLLKSKSQEGNNESSPGSSASLSLEELKAVFSECERSLALSRLELGARTKQKDAECAGEESANEELKDAKKSSVRYMRASVKVKSQHTLCDSEKQVVASLEKQVQVQEERCKALKP